MFTGQGPFGPGKPQCLMPATAGKTSMSQVQYIHTEAIDGERRVPAVVKRCKSCWRDDFHEAVKLPMFVFGFLLVATFGLILFVKPYQCVCCGTKRLG